MRLLIYLLLTTTFISPSIFSATITGIVTSNATGTPIAGAKLGFSLGTTNVDSAVTNASGQYTLTINAGTYTVTASASGYKDSLGNNTRTLTAAVTFGGTTNLNTTLTPATSQISGTVHQNSLAGAGLFGAKVVLQRRVGTAGLYYTLDSTLTDASGIFLFSNLVATIGTGFGTGAQAPNYRLQSIKISGNIIWGASVVNGSPANTVLTAANVPIGGAFNAAIVLFCCADAITPYANTTSQSIRFFTLGDHMILELTASTVARIIDVVDLKGTVQHRVDVPPGESQVFVPGTYAPENGFLFLVK